MVAFVLWGGASEEDIEVLTTAEAGDIPPTVLEIDPILENILLEDDLAVVHLCLHILLHGHDLVLRPCLQNGIFPFRCLLNKYIY